jgi:hypothetical protein
VVHRVKECGEPLCNSLHFPSGAAWQVATSLCWSNGCVRFCGTLSAKQHFIKNCEVSKHRERRTIANAQDKFRFFFRSDIRIKLGLEVLTIRGTNCRVTQHCSG